jgi:hypothetical protein
MRCVHVARAFTAHVRDLGLRRKTILALCHHACCMRARMNMSGCAPTRSGCAPACAVTTQAPTPPPTNSGDTHAPTISPTAASLSNTFTSSITGCRYATIDDWPLTDANYYSIGCTSTPMSVPGGWELATNTADSRRAAYSSSWGCIHLVFADGSAWGSRGGGNSSSCCGDFLGASGSQYYARSVCYSRVFIRNCATSAPTAAPTTRTPTLVPTAAG